MSDSSGITNSTEIFLLEKDPIQAKKLFEKIEEILLNKGIYGSYHIVAVSSVSDSGENFSDYIEKNKSVVVAEQRYNQFTHRLS